MATMPDIKLKQVTAGELNKPAWYRTHTAELGPEHAAGEGPASITTADVYLGGEPSVPYGDAGSARASGSTAPTASTPSTPSSAPT
jgi:hypothetical protein